MMTNPAQSLHSTEPRQFHRDEFTATQLLAAKAGRTISICLPARNEAATVGRIVERLVSDLVVAVPLLDEVIVMDDHSTDATAAVSLSAGAHVVNPDDVLVSQGPGTGKGEMLWKSLAVSTGDIVIWCDADIEDFEPSFVVGLLGPLLTTDDVVFAKGRYRRPQHGERGGGRVTELVVRPLLSMFFPDLCSFAQPLSGEYGGRRDVLEALAFIDGYGVDIGLLIDVANRHGIHAMAQVDLEVRHHRNRSLHDLSAQAMAVTGTILHKAQPGLVDPDAPLLGPDGEVTAISVRERPPLAELSEA